MDDPVPSNEVPSLEKIWAKWTEDGLVESPVPPLTPEQMWDKFIDHLNKTVPLSKPQKDHPPPKHLNFLGSIKEYRKIFLEANK